ncbi:MAG: hypothetical protein U0821_01175 [Chloroflexota bacterium]
MALALLLSLGLFCWELFAMPAALVRGTQVALDENDLDLHVFDEEAARTLAALAAPDEFVLTDHPYIAFLAKRMVPPELVDPSRGRARAGTLTEEVAARAATERDVAVVMFWADRLKRLGKFNNWVDQRYEPVASFGARNAKNRRGKDRTIFLRNDRDLDSARAALTGTLGRAASIEFNGDIRLLGAAIEPISAPRSEPFDITLAWEGLRDVRFNYKLIVSLVGGDGREYAAQEQDLEGPTDSGEGWMAGRWMIRGYMVTPTANARAGDYTVQISLDHPRTGGRVTPSGSGLDVIRDGRLVVGSVSLK